ncbi:hypothetical protein D9757_005306 [Collybiopsis confluens]|uniref:L-tryptophan decarboxylase PsiD-like domain-containing protein n=1 Tax=Collybiopsis confluens TaxID=2823264 RepID=A0A8H5HVL4_9AGAR|nr:hypothetical protein D9757_005306 [Collybiopsis confluens]
MSPLVKYPVSGWFPKDSWGLESWLHRKPVKAEQRKKRREPQRHPVIEEFRILIETDTDLYMEFNAMFEQIPTTPPYDNDPTGKPQVRDYMTMLNSLDRIITQAPDFEQNEFVGFPINAILCWPMGTQAGLSAFMKPKVNEMFKKVFDVWSTFLASEGSRYVLSDAENGWFGPVARAALPNFDDTFICDPNAEYHGFSSWDNFFTRLFRPGVRPVFAPQDDRIITCACESTVYAIQEDIKAHDGFWLKHQPYSLFHMLDNDPFASQFVGGTICQAYLSALDYHRWHSPVSGTIVKTVLIPGAYYTESPAMGFPRPDPVAQCSSQGFITHTATRGLIFIQSDNPMIGLMCFISVGMAEVSTNEITVRKGQKVKKGDELGMFHFGGSTYCLLFRRGVKVIFDSNFQGAHTIVTGRHGLCLATNVSLAELSTVCDMSSIVRHRVGGWLPKDPRVLQSWLDKKLAKAELREKQREFRWHPVIQEFQKLIENDADLYMDFHAMFEQVPLKPPYNNDPTGKPQVRNYLKMLSLFDLILTEAPDYEQNDLVGFPINAILDWPMGTQAGLSAFMKPKVNEMFKKMFNVWVTFLESKQSCYVLSTADNGWFGPQAQEALPDFDATFVCDPSAEYHGYTSWDNFFTRLFRPGVRPVFEPEDNRIINSACESTVYAIQDDIKAHDHFWLKGEPYSLFHILDNDPLAPQFVGGTICQAFLSALNYHRWHSPVNGKIVKTVLIPGTYYAESPATGFPDPDPSGPNLSQGFITQVAARALIFIECDNPAIGLLCFVSVGMAEVSTNEITVYEGQQVKKGDQLGMFHFGGSTHCLIFRPGVPVVFEADYTVAAAVQLNAPIATVG